MNKIIFNNNENYIYSLASYSSNTVYTVDAMGNDIISNDIQITIADTVANTRNIYTLPSNITSLAIVTESNQAIYQLNNLHETAISSISESYNDVSKEFQINLLLNTTIADLSQQE